MLTDQARALLAHGKGLLIKFKNTPVGRLGNSVF